MNMLEDCDLDRFPKKYAETIDRYKNKVISNVRLTDQSLIITFEDKTALKFLIAVKIAVKNDI